jgi:hypothetical protein
MDSRPTSVQSVYDICVFHDAASQMMYCVYMADTTYGFGGDTQNMLMALVLC